jgi:GR25 family glycosyltransferase involved in LPS biosynthesis
MEIPTYYINLERSTVRNETMKKMYPHATRVEAFDGKCLDAYDNIILPKTTTSSPYELACSLSHIKAIHTAYINGDKGALILEDDTHNTFQKLWIHSVDEIAKITPKEIDCVVLMCSNPRELITMINMKNVFSKWIPARWSTSAYYVTRTGMKKVIDKFVIDGNKYTLDIEGMTRHCADNDILYTPMNTYNYTRPTFIPECNDSVIHENHLNIHKTALSVMIQYFNYVGATRK